MKVEPQYLLALDVAYRRSKDKEYGFGVALLYDKYHSKIINCYTAIREVCIPYIPGLLAFREMYLLVPAILKVLKKHKVDLILVDGHGISHPRGLGIASHVGVAFKKPAIGIAKKRLVGMEELCDHNKVCIIYEGKVVGAKVKTPKGSWIYVSPGNLITLEDSVNIVKDLFRSPYKLPYPLHLADVVSKASKSIKPHKDKLKIVACPSILDLSL